MVRNRVSPVGTSGGAWVVGGGGSREAMLAPCLVPGSAAPSRCPSNITSCPTHPSDVAWEGQKNVPAEQVLPLALARNPQQKEGCAPGRSGLPGGAGRERWVGRLFLPRNF